MNRLATYHDAEHAAKCERMRNWYHRNPEKVKESNARWRAESREWFNEYKTTLKCETCGESHPACLDFHHRDPKEKDKSIAHAISAWKVPRIQKEIAKCIVLCSNCHRKLHAESK